MIKILSARIGFATNSSSAHSMIILNKGDTLPPEEGPDYGNNFGWDNFVLTSKRQKGLYFGAILYHALNGILPERATNILMKELVGTSVAAQFEDDGNSPSIDHQSMYAIPYEFNKDFIDLEFAEEFNKYLMKREVVILGGNDNDDDDHPLYDKELDPGFKSIQDTYGLVCRKDKKYGYWVLFNRKRGTKVRFQFEGNKKENKPPKRAYAPELIDIKITDYCDKKCGFCYQASTETGKHAEEVSQIAYTLSKLKVFEVALGGGEPTSHPEFIDILKSFREYGTVPNFTTKSLEWVRDKEILEAVKKNVGSFSYSVMNATDVKEAHRVFKRYKIDGMAQYNVVMGTTDEKGFRYIMEAVRKLYRTVVLLGFKTVGRGAEGYQPFNYDWLPSVLEEMNEKSEMPRTSIDTVLASEFEEEWASIGVSPYMLEMVDGSYSCYIDAVNKKIGPSSYCDAGEMVDLPQWDGLELENALETAMDRYEEYVLRMRRKKIKKNQTRVQYLELD